MAVKVIESYIEKNSNWELIASALVTNTANSSVSFQNIPQTYTDLKLMWTEVVAGDYHHIKFNADNLNHAGGGTGNGAAFGFGASSNTAGQIFSNTTNANYLTGNSNLSSFIGTSPTTSRSNGFAIFSNYQASSKKAIRWESWGGSNVALKMGFGYYSGSSPITSFEIKNFFATSTIYGNFYLYGNRIGQ
jgi:hypothetical protein